MNLESFNKEVKPFYTAYKADVITQNEFLAALNSILNNNNVIQQTMKGYIVTIKDGLPVNKVFSKWIELPKDNLIVDYCLGDKLEGEQCPLGVFRLSDLNKDRKDTIIQYRGEPTSSETNKEMFTYVSNKISNKNAQIKQANDLKK